MDCISLIIYRIPLAHSILGTFTAYDNTLHTRMIRTAGVERAI